MLKPSSFPSAGPHEGALLSGINMLISLASSTGTGLEEDMSARRLDFLRAHLRTVIKPAGFKSSSPRRRTAVRNKLVAFFAVAVHRRYCACFRLIVVPAKAGIVRPWRRT